MPALVPREVYHAGARALPAAVRRGAARPFQLIVTAIFSRPRRRRSRQEGHHRLARLPCPDCRPVTSHALAASQVMLQ